MRSFLLPLLYAAFTTSAAAQVANGVPHINFTPSCRASVSGANATTAEFDSCRRSEEAARRQIAEQWNQFPAADRSACRGLTSAGTPGTYTELLTCLEMKRDVRNLRANGSNSSGTVGLGGTRRR